MDDEVEWLEDEEELSDLLPDAFVDSDSVGQSAENEQFDVEYLPPATTFDVSLAARHAYLGSDLEELRGRTVHDEGAIIWIPLLLELGIVLVPGQTLPLTVFYPPTIAMLREVISKDKTFGIVCLKDSPRNQMTMSQIGTTAEIFQYQEDSGLVGFKIKAKGRQRFRLLEQKRKMPGVLLGQVEILPEIMLPPPMQEARMRSLDRHRRNSGFGVRAGLQDLAAVTLPRWVLAQYDAECLVQRVLTELTSLKFVESMSNVPTGPLNLSYWVVQCLPMDDIHRVWLLGLNSCVERLQYALKLLGECTVIYCQGCRKRLASRRDIFPMSVEGPMGTYCNPGGHVHEILTVYLAKGMVLAQQAPSTDHTWFPGYGWTIASCEGCLSHTGWLFTAMEPGLHPARFWGLTRRCVTMHRTPATPGRRFEPSHSLQEFFDSALSYV